MSRARRSLSLLLLAAAAGLALPGAAGAQATPAAVTVRVEGATRTLLETTTVTTTTTPVDKAGTPCSGTSAGGALEQATQGAWSGPVDPDTGQRVQTILGETHPADAGDPRRFVLSVNSVPTSVSPCALELNPGDTVLFFVSTAAPERTCVTNGRDGRCGTPDRTAPASVITSVKEQARFTRRSAPIVLAGRVADDPSGLADVRLRLTRTIGASRCAYFDGIEDDFQRATPCGVLGGRFFSIGSDAAWSWTLPARLTRGRYTLDVTATDRLGNTSTSFARGRDRIVFTVV